MNMIKIEKAVPKFRSIFFLVILFCLVFLGFNGRQVAAQEESEICPDLSPGDAIKISGSVAIYAINRNSDVLNFPDGDVFKSWKPGYGGSKIVSSECFDVLSLPEVPPRKVIYRSGTYIIKKSGLAQLYVVEPGNTIAKISKVIATKLYGRNYAVKTVKAVDWENYVNQGDAVTASEPHVGMLISTTVNVGKSIKKNKTYYVDSGKVLREVTNAGFTANSFQKKFVRAMKSSYLKNFTVNQAGIIRDKVFTMFDEMPDDNVLDEIPEEPIDQNEPVISTSTPPAHATSTPAQPASLAAASVRADSRLGNETVGINNIGHVTTTLLGAYDFTTTGSGNLTITRLGLYARFGGQFPSFNGIYHLTVDFVDKSNGRILLTKDYNEISNFNNPYFGDVNLNVAAGTNISIKVYSFLGAGATDGAGDADTVRMTIAPEYRVTDENGINRVIMLDWVSGRTLTVSVAELSVSLRVNNQYADRTVNTVPATLQLLGAFNLTTSDGVGSIKIDKLNIMARFGGQFANGGISNLQVVFYDDHNFVLPQTYCTLLDPPVDGRSLYSCDRLRIPLLNSGNIMFVKVYGDINISATDNAGDVDTVQLSISPGYTWSVEGAITNKRQLDWVNGQTTTVSNADQVTATLSVDNSLSNITVNAPVTGQLLGAFDFNTTGGNGMGLTVSKIGFLLKGGGATASNLRVDFVNKNPHSGNVPFFSKTYTGVTSFYNPQFDEINQVIIAGDNISIKVYGDLAATGDASAAAGTVQLDFMTDHQSGLGNLITTHTSDWLHARTITLSAPVQTPTTPSLSYFTGVVQSKSVSSFVVKVGDSTYTVNTGSDTVVYQNGTLMGLDVLKSGDTVTVAGYLNGNVITAEQVNIIPWY